MLPYLINASFSRGRQMLMHPRNAFAPLHSSQSAPVVVLLVVGRRDEVVGAAFELDELGAAHVAPVARTIPTPSWWRWRWAASLGARRCWRRSGGVAVGTYPAAPRALAGRHC